MGGKTTGAGRVTKRMMVSMIKASIRKPRSVVRLDGAARRSVSALNATYTSSSSCRKRSSITGAGAARTKTPTGSRASSCPREPTSPCTARASLTPSPGSSTSGEQRPRSFEPQQRPCRLCCSGHEPTVKGHIALLVPLHECLGASNRAKRASSLLRSKRPRSSAAGGRAGRAKSSRQPRSPLAPVAPLSMSRP